MQRTWLVIAGSLVLATTVQAQSEAELLQIEVAAAKAALSGNIARNMIAVDSMYAAPGQVPGSPASSARPAGRTAALRNSVTVPSTYRRPYGATLLLLSRPEVSGDVATVSATTFRTTARGRREFVTTRVTLRRQGGRWGVEKSEELGRG